MKAILKFPLNKNLNLKYFCAKSTRRMILCSLPPRKTLYGTRKYSSHSSSQNIVKSPLGDIQMKPMLLHEKVFEDMSLWENKIAIRCGLTGRRYKYYEMMKNSKALAGAFQNKFKLEKGATIAVVLPNCPEYPIIILAASQAGVIPTTISPNYTSHEIEKQAQDCKVKLLITSSNIFEKCFKISESMKLSNPLIVLKLNRTEPIPPGAVDLLELFDPSNAASFKPVEIKEEDVLLIPYSSGTSGSPKGVLLTHKGVVSNIIQISHPETNVLYPTTRFHQDKIMGILPMFHVYGLIIGTIYSLARGCQVLSMPKFDPVLYVKNILLYRASVLYVVPQIIDVLAHEKVKKFYLRSVQFLVNASAPLILKNAYKLLDKAQHIKIAQGYGMTEASPAVSHTYVLRMQKLNSIGIPIASTTIKVASLETREPLGKGELGELCVLGPQLMKGYLNRPEETKNAFDEEGYLKTGDVGYYDDDGDFYVVERLKDLIKVKGFQVAPSELEETLRSHPKIQNAAVAGIPHEKYGEVPRAFVILKKKGTMTEEEVKNFISGKLSDYKHLRGGVEFVDDLPKNIIGKILKRQLKNR